MAINECLIGCICVYYGHLLTYMDILISIINFIVLIILCASNFKICLELIYSHLLKHCYLFCENKHYGLID